MGGGAERLPIVAHCLGPIRSHLGRAEAAEAKLRTLDLDVIHDIGVGWHSHVLQSEDGSRIAMWERRLRLLPRWLRGIKRQMINVLPRYRDFRTLMARQFGDPERIVVAISQMCVRDFQEYHGVAAERIRLVYHGVDVEPVHSLATRASPRAGPRPAGNRPGGNGGSVRGPRSSPQGAGDRRPRGAKARRAAARRSGCWSSAGGGAEAAPGLGRNAARAR